MNQASLYFQKQLLTYFGVLVAEAMKPLTRTSWHLPGHILLGWFIMLVCGQCMGKDTTWIKDLHHNYPDVPLSRALSIYPKFL